jgi:hypothetical protein
VQHSLERIVEYVTRRLPVSGERVVVAGRGLGATAALWSALYTEWLDARFVALAPRGERALQLEGLPDRAPVTRSVLIAVEARALEASRWLADDYRTVGVEAELRALAADASPGAELEVALRSAFGLERRAVRGAEAELVVLERDLPRARQWGEVYAERLRTGERAARVVLAAELKGDEDPARVHRLALGDEWPLASFAEGKGIPLAPGDFGGTTLLVVPAGTEPSTREAWLALERDKVLKKRSPFANLRVALADGEPGLAQVTGELAASGAHSVLVVPAVFCASPAEMQALASTLRVSDAADALDLTFLPGLGAELVGGGEEE